MNNFKTIGLQTVKKFFLIQMFFFILIKTFIKLLHHRPLRINIFVFENQHQNNV